MLCSCELLDPRNIWIVKTINNRCFFVLSSLCYYFMQKQKLYLLFIRYRVYESYQIACCKCAFLFLSHSNCSCLILKKCNTKMFIWSGSVLIIIPTVTVERVTSVISGIMTDIKKHFWTHLLILVGVFCVGISKIWDENRRNAESILVCTTGSRKREFLNKSVC